MPVRNARPESNRERQRRFRERNPGYYSRRRTRARAEYAAMKAQIIAEMKAIAAKPEPLMLPAPVETIYIPGMTMLATTPAPVPQLVMIPREALIAA